MNRTISLLSTGLTATLIPLLIAGAVLTSVALQAAEGHDHGEAASPAAATASPRVAAHSDLFEAVGIVDGGAMTIYLDLFGTNAPVTGARVEVEAGTARGLAAAQADGTYRFEHAIFKEEGVLPVSFTVTDKAGTDLLAGDLTLGAASDGHGHGEGAAPVPRRWVTWAAGAAAALAVLALACYAAFVIGRRSRRAGPF